MEHGARRSEFVGTDRVARSGNGGLGGGGAGGRPGGCDAFPGRVGPVKGWR